MICVQKNTSVTKRVQNENYVTIIGYFPFDLWIVVLVHIAFMGTLLFYFLYVYFHGI